MKIQTTRLLKQLRGEKEKVAHNTISDSQILKFSATHSRFFRFDGKGDLEANTESTFRSNVCSLYKDATVENENIDAAVDVSIGSLVAGVDKFCREGSDWSIRRVVEVCILMSAWIPLVGSAYVETPS